MRPADNSWLILVLHIFVSFIHFPKGITEEHQSLALCKSIT